VKASVDAEPSEAMPKSAIFHSQKQDYTKILSDAMKGEIYNFVESTPDEFPFERE
jgi:hypothetical protein